MLLGIIDWGIGGLGLLRLLREQQPELRAVYFSDSGARPYGKLSRAELRARLTSVTHYLGERGVTHLAVACNAASTGVIGYDPSVLSQPIPTEFGAIEVTGVVAHALQAARALPASHVGVIGGGRTIRSRIYPRHLRDAGHRVTQRIAQPLSQFVEAGDLSSETLKAELRRILRPLAGVDALLLACTHYPALAARMQEQLPGVRLLDPAAEMSRWIRRAWVTHPELSRGPSPRVLNAQKPPANGITFLTTGDPAGFQRAGRAAFQVDVIAPQQVRLNR